MKVHIGIPCYGGKIDHRLIGVIQNAGETKLQVQTGNFSILTRNFNGLYAKALNSRKDGVTHFLMLHDDVIPMENGWLDKMMEISAEKKADILSVVLPIKDARGLTSTALDNLNHPYKVTRLTLDEVYKLPETFTFQDLLINTGLMLVDIRTPEAEGLCFQFEDWIESSADGFRPVGMSEDWVFSREAHKVGMSVFATRAISAIHMGHNGFANTQPWGRWKRDEEAGT